MRLIHRGDLLGVMGSGSSQACLGISRSADYPLPGAERKIALVILTDYPGFNMKVRQRESSRCSRALKRRRLFVGAGRIPKLAQLITKAAVILPFEKALLRGHGIDATFVGHPLLDRTVNMPTRTEAREALGLALNEPVLALFPGSRQQEIDRHIDAFVATAKQLQTRIPSLNVIVSVAQTVALDSNSCPSKLEPALAPELRASRCRPLQERHDDTGSLDRRLSVGGRVSDRPHLICARQAPGKSDQHRPRQRRGG